MPPTGRWVILSATGGIRSRPIKKCAGRRRWIRRMVIPSAASNTKSAIPVICGETAVGFHSGIARLSHWRLPPSRTEPRIPMSTSLAAGGRSRRPRSMEELR